MSFKPERAVLAATSPAPQESLNKVENRPVKNVPVRLNSISKCCWFVEVELYSKKVCFLVDTGSSLSFISEDVFDSLPVHLVLTELDTVLTTADGDILSVQGKTNVTLLFGSHEFSQSVVLAKLGGLSGILGLDFL